VAAAAAAREEAGEEGRGEGRGRVEGCTGKRGAAEARAGHN